MRKRSVRLSFILCIIGGLLLLRLMWVQIIEGHHYEEMALNQTEGVQTLYSPAVPFMTEMAGNWLFPLW